ncbi:hypothetical protein CYLTODRAFT_427593 [Cylindrobasidium torrendii FP15055 ss-10]|uniref:NYN domain-containing protein n=1 Tax=Cylindrobasidium torrendii FP15055 ss-10 TaxID=1314674 RepID=A0A0D7ATK2_9AGAR|nr:hypothetical protein CYLTODRAFT_427593 [Cylindrobasidium torrendii FP15055 ss-10]
MIRTNSDSTTLSSPAPASPFSAGSTISEATSDEQPNLGAFTTVFREWNYLQPSPRRTALGRQPSTRSTTNTSSILSSEHTPSELDSEADALPQGSTVWAQRPIASYLKSGDTATQTATDLTNDHENDRPPDDPGDAGDASGSSDTEADGRLSRTVYITSCSDDIDIQSSRSNGTEGDQLDLIAEMDLVMPTLGFQEALSFLATERERLTARAPTATVYNGKLLSMAAASEPRRKRRRKPNESPSPSNYTPSSAPTSNNPSGSSAESSFNKSPARRRPNRLRNSKSSPGLRLDAEDVFFLTKLFETKDDTIRVRAMKALMKKIFNIFPDDTPDLRRVDLGTLDASDTNFTTNYTSSKFDVSEDTLGPFVDTRGPPAGGEKDERIIHVFVDHSNILIGLLNYLRRFPLKHPQHQTPKPLRHLSHSALTLLLERGRPVSRRVIVASSPLYQPMHSAEMLGYEVRVFARVPDMGDGMDRAQRPIHGRTASGSSGVVAPSSLPDGSSPKHTRANSNGGRRKGHLRKVSGNGNANGNGNGNGSGSVENGDGAVLGPVVQKRGSGPPATPPAAGTSSPPKSAMSTPLAVAEGGPQPATRIRYREQGVDELLQLKLHQALAGVDGTPPEGSTIVLATGDGNVGQFNEDGFLGGVRTALRRGWNVELYAWETGLNKAWRKEFGEASEWTPDRFKIIGLEQFGTDLVEVYDEPLAT